MEMAWNILKQTLVMGLYMAGGFALYKGGKITQEGSRTIANLLLWLVIPMVLVRSFCVEFTAEKLSMLAQSFLLSALALVLSVGAATLIYRKHPVDCFAVAFSNCGFIGIPLVTAALGEGAVFFLCGMLVCSNVLQWTWGTAVVGRRKMDLAPKALLLSPFVLATLVGIFLFVTGLGARLPSVVQDAMAGIAGLNGPIAMIVLGVYLAQTQLRTLFTTPRLYVLSVVRMWLVPLATLLLFWLLPFDRTIGMTVLISAAAPVGANTAVYAQMYDGDYPYACQSVALSTVLSIAMMPLFMMLASSLLGV